MKILESGKSKSKPNALSRLWKKSKTFRKKGDGVELLVEEEDEEGTLAPPGDGRSIEIKSLDEAETVDVDDNCRKNIERNCAIESHGGIVECSKYDDSNAQNGELEYTKSNDREKLLTSINNCDGNEDVIDWDFALVGDGTWRCTCDSEQNEYENELTDLVKVEKNNNKAKHCPVHSEAVPEKKKKKKSKKKKAKKARKNAWKACKSGWKYVKAGLVLYVGTPASSINVTNISQAFGNKKSSHRI